MRPTYGKPRPRMSFVERALQQVGPQRRQGRKELPSLCILGLLPGVPFMVLFQKSPSQSKSELPQLVSLPLHRSHVYDTTLDPCLCLSPLIHREFKARAL